MQSTINNSNRIDAALEQWDKQHEKYVNRYGPAVVKDRDYQKVCRDIHKQIYEQFKSDRSLTFAEKMDLRVIKGQINQMNRGLYTRAGRAMRLAGNISKSILKGLFSLPLQMGSMLLFRRPLPNNNALSRQPIPLRRTNNEISNGNTLNLGKFPAKEVAIDTGKKSNVAQTSPDGSTIGDAATTHQTNTDQNRHIQRNFRNKVRRVLETERSQSKGI